MVKSELYWKASYGCPSGQLEKVNDTTYKILAKGTTVVESKEDCYVWVNVGTENELNISLENYIGLFQSQNGIRSVLNYLISFDKTKKREVIKALHNTGFIQFQEVAEGLLVDLNINRGFLENIEGVDKVEEIAIIQRKEYLPTLVGTGILIEGLPWHNLVSSNCPRSFRLASNKVDISKGELTVGVYPLADYSIIREGEILAEVVFTKKVNLKLDLDSYVG